MAIFALLNPSAVGLADVPLPSVTMASFLSTLSADQILSPFYHFFRSNGAYAGDTLLTGSLLDAVKQHGLGADPAVLLALQISLARALDWVMASLGSTASSNSDELELDEFVKDERASTLRWSLGALGHHLAALAPTWPTHLARSINGRTAQALLAQVDEHRPLLNRLAGGRAMATWDLLDGRTYKFAQRSRLHAFLLRLRGQDSAPPTSASDSSTSARAAAVDPLTNAEIISFVRPALVDPQCSSVSLLALAILDRTSLFGLSRPRMPPVSPAERKAAIEARADAWCSLVADMDCKSPGYDYEESRRARKQQACQLYVQLSDIFDYSEDVSVAMADVHKDELWSESDGDLAEDGWEDCWDEHLSREPDGLVWLHDLSWNVSRIHG